MILSFRILQREYSSSFNTIRKRVIIPCWVLQIGLEPAKAFGLHGFLKKEEKCSFLS